ncbi:FAD synthetase family protein [Nocardioides nitrophenolicus]|uniref:FAD synthetase family protein n=1 Tax=Nocardioides nitrophenolicus TaxID=60489 RepID=UPI000B1B4EE0|nr:FAD synthetase family protein [Nocardioides nitrophenolicus]MBM7518621.1 riboflavin kinase/FMN adenylyltransferase [Nocardioides nitrophenolicus]
MEVRKFSTPPSDGEAVAWELQCLPSSDSGESLSRVAIGTFDGVHVGHQSVIRGCGTVVTFDQPPVNVLSTKNPKKLISDLPTRLRRMERLGVRRVVLIEFDRAWSTVSAGDFASTLREQFGCRSVRVGENFRFGRGGTGTPATFEEGALAVDSVGLRVHHNAAVSSTRIRDLVEGGSIVEARSLMGAPLTLPYSRTDSRNVMISDDFVTPPPGIYVARVQRKPVVVTVGDGGGVDLPAAFDCGHRNYISFNKEL